MQDQPCPPVREPGLQCCFQHATVKSWELIGPGDEAINNYYSKCKIQGVNSVLLRLSQHTPFHIDHNLSHADEAETTVTRT